MKASKRSVGVLGEATAEHFLVKNGVRILKKNFRCRAGEIDLIGWDGRYYLVIEVKLRSSDQQGLPAEAVDLRKQKKICYVFDYYRMKHALDEYVPVRFDIVEVDAFGQCRWIQNAFEYLE